MTSRLFGLHLNAENFANLKVERRNSDNLTVAALRIGGRVFRRVMQAATAGMSSANGRERAGLGTRQSDHLLHDSQNQCCPGGDIELLEKAVQMRVDGVIRDLEPPGYARFREIVKDASDDLRFTLGEAQSPGNLKPSVIVEN